MKNSTQKGCTCASEPALPCEFHGTSPLTPQSNQVDKPGRVVRRIWTNGVETWVAPTLEDARQAALKNICLPEELSEEDLAICKEDVQWDDWYEMSGNKVLTIHSDDGEPTKIQTADQWAADAESDTEFLCSTEW